MSAFGSELRTDLRTAARSLGRRPGWTATAVATLALGLGGAIAVGSVAYGVLLRPLPYPEPDRLVRVYEVGAKGQRMRVADPNFGDLAALDDAFEGLAQYAAAPLSVRVGDGAARVVAADVSRDFFPLLGVEPIVGRLFRDEEQRLGAAPTLLVSEKFWRERLGARRELDGISVASGGTAFAVVGVLPAGFDFPFGADLWAPRELSAPLPSRTAHNLHAFGRLRAGVDAAAAAAQANALAERLRRELGDRTDMAGVALVPLLASLVGDARPTLLVQLGAAAFLFLIATVNVGSLLLARVESNRRELAVRLALGAGRGQITRYLLAESLLVTSAAALAGGALAAGALTLLRDRAAFALPRLDAVRIDAPIALLAFALALGTAIALALATARRALSWNVESELRAGGRRLVGGGKRRLQGAPIALQAGAAFVLLVGAALLGTSARRLLAVDPGFRADGVVALELTPGELADESASIARVRDLDALLTRLGALPGVRAAGLVTALPLAGDPANGTFIDLGGAPPPADFEQFESLMRGGATTGDALYLAASEGYFPALAIPLRAGRWFTAGDDRDAPHVALVSESVARQTWPDQSALGKRLEFGNMDGDLRALTVVGVVGDVRQTSLGEAPAAAIYVPFRQRPQTTAAVSVVIAAPDAGTATARIAREALAAARELLPAAPARARTMVELVETSWSDRRLLLELVSLFAASALALAAGGVFGAVALAVAGRQRDYALRLALGATPREVTLHALGVGLRPAGIGFALGALASLALGQLAGAMLFELRPAHPPAYLLALAAVAVVAFVASWIPARRASAIAPAAALNAD